MSTCSEAVNEIDALPEDHLIVFKIDFEFSGGKLPHSHQFSWDSFAEDAKGDKGDF